MKNSDRVRDRIIVLKGLIKQSEVELKAEIKKEKESSNE